MGMQYLEETRMVVGSQHSRLSAGRSSQSTSVTQHPDDDVGMLPQHTVEAGLPPPLPQQ